MALGEGYGCGLNPDAVDKRRTTQPARRPIRTSCHCGACWEVPGFRDGRGRARVALKAAQTIFAPNK